MSEERLAESERKSPVPYDKSGYDAAPKSQKPMFKMKKKSRKNRLSGAGTKDVEEAIATTSLCEPDLGYI